MERRTFLAMIAGGMVAAPLAAEAQQAGKVSRVGYLGTFRPVNTPELQSWNSFVEGLRERGWVEGQNLVIDRRFPAETSQSYSELVAEFLRLRVDVLVTASSEAAWAAKKSTSTTPIVVAVANVVGQGLAASLPRPGGNLTGISNQLEVLQAKRYQILRELAPRVAREAIVYHPDNPASAGLIEEQRRVAGAAGITAFPVGVRASADLPTLYDAIVTNRCDAMNIHLSVTKFSQWRELIDWGTKQRLVVSSSAFSFVAAGAIMALGNDVPDQMRRLAFYVDRILRGTSPADLPIEQPTKFRFVINLKTAKTIGLTIPPSLLLRADQVIE